MAAETDHPVVAELAATRLTLAVATGEPIVGQPAVVSAAAGRLPAAVAVDSCLLV